ncbi:uncharacterized protein BO72DRAFT_523851 [Aspergillus fijiensis CBS 313.89]|uniref:Nucleoside phosphorylase domain-containing protein n=1 Tax=Aspergillus fijiensis CBS 313.89 TaxID=1448319 RepID=A0A8G1RZN7_9EURO|nr:uncharacterized protein BO72DRAFT_523851 [Aspergillus fijiensis CBS 313.89]RAK81958.1 hypothetical protein BO72DRAFT_523851 [Aspergillus fijiensis CBS 313.89]
MASAFSQLLHDLRDPTDADLPPAAAQPPPQIALFCRSGHLELVKTIFHEIHETDDSISPGALSTAPGTILGRIGRTTALLSPVPDIGKTRTAKHALDLKLSLPSIDVAIVIGCCTAAPDAEDGRQIFPVDVLLADGVVEYDIGRLIPGGRFVRKDVGIIRPCERVWAVLDELREGGGGKELGDRIGIEGDRGVGIHVGTVASGDRTLDNNEEREALRTEVSAVGLDVGGLCLGVATVFRSCLVVLGVDGDADEGCGDCGRRRAVWTADGHKEKRWQPYAALSAACCVKALLAGVAGESQGLEKGACGGDRVSQSVAQGGPAFGEDEVWFRSWRLCVAVCLVGVLLCLYV